MITVPSAFHINEGMMRFAGLVEIDDVDTTAEVEEEAEVKPSEEEQCDNR